MSLTWRKVTMLPAKTLLLLPCCYGCLWWAYSQSAQIAGGYGTQSEHVIDSLNMALLVSALALVIWLISPFIHKAQSHLREAINVSLEFALVLILYTVAVLIWRNSWTPEAGFNDAAAFGPFFGHINAVFFAEYLWLEFLVVIIPIMAILAGLLTFGFAYLESGR